MACVKINASAVAKDVKGVVANRVLRFVRDIVPWFPCFMTVNIAKVVGPVTAQFTFHVWVKNACQFASLSDLIGLSTCFKTPIKDGSFYRTMTK